jgi:hypothetical protein
MDMDNEIWLSQQIALPELIRTIETRWGRHPDAEPLSESDRQLTTDILKDYRLAYANGEVFPPFQQPNPTVIQLGRLVQGVEVATAQGQLNSDQNQEIWRQLISPHSQEIIPKRAISAYQGALQLKQMIQDLDLTLDNRDHNDTSSSPVFDQPPGWYQELTNRNSDEERQELEYALERDQNEWIRGLDLAREPRNPDTILLPVRMLFPPESE